MRLLVVLMMCLCLVPGIEAQKKGRKATNVSSLNSKLRSVRQNQAKIQKEIRQAKARTQWVVKDIDKVDHRLTVVSGQLEETNENLSANKVAQKRIANELIETGHRLDETREQLRRRLRAIYEEGDGSYLTVLTGSQSLGDLAVRADMMQRIAEHDRELFDRYVGLKQAVTSRKRQQDHVVREIGRLAVHHRRKASELSSVRREKQEALQSLRARQNQLRAMLAQFQADENAIEGQIAAYMRRIAAERRRRMIAKRVRRGKRMVTVMVPAPALQFTGRLGRPVNGPLTS
ncbi:MAG TPA: hypothetical protein VGE01_07710, partial [Fimbriimonas sp.]